MGWMSVTDKQAKITSKLNVLYYTLLSCKDRNEFLKEIEKKFNQEAKHYKNFLKDEALKDHYTSEKNRLAKQFEDDKQKDIKNDIEKIDNNLKSKLSYSLTLKDEEKFRENYNGLKEKLLKDYKNEEKKAEIEKYIDNWIDSKVMDFNKKKHEEKEKYIYDFIIQSYEELKDLIDSEDGFNKSIEEKKNNNNLLLEYLKEEAFLKYYNEKLKDKLMLFKIVLKNRKNLKKDENEKNIKNFFIDNYSELKEISNNEEELKENYEQRRKTDSTIKNIFDENKDYYNQLLEERLKLFKAELTKRQNEQSEQVKNKFYKFFNDNFYKICDKSSDENNFKKNFEDERKLRTDIDNYYENGYSSTYDTILSEFVKNFHNYLKDKQNNYDSEIKNKYESFLGDEYDNVAKDSKDENTFRLKYKEKLKEKEELINNLNKYEAHYNQLLEKRVVQFKNVLKARIEKSYNDNFDSAIEASETESNFKTNIQELVESEPDLKKLLQIKEYKDSFDSLHNSKNIQNKLNKKIEQESNTNYIEAENFLDGNYKKIKEKCNTKEEFQEEMEKIASEKIKNASNFKTKLEKLTKDFEREKKEENEGKIREEKMNEYKQQETKLINDFIQGIDKKNFEDEGSIKHFKSFDHSKFEAILQKLFNEEKYANKINDKIVSFINELLDDKNKKVSHLNILLCGNSGAGKSTLINAMLELEGKDKLATDTGERVTMETKYVFSKKFPIFRLGDSRGTEISKSGPESYGIEKVVESMNEFIQSQLNTKNPDNYVHCIWYCVMPLDERFNVVIEECLNELENNYVMKGIPIIIVGTKANSNEANQKIANYFKKKNIKYPFHPVLAEKMDNNEPYGLEELRLLSLEKAMDGIESSCYQGIIKDISETSKLKVEEQDKIIEQKIKDKKEQVFKNIENKPDFDILKKDMKETFNIILNQYSSINLSNKNKKIEELKLGEKSKSEIDKFISDYYNFCKGYYQQNYEKIIDTRTNELINKIKMEKSEFITTYLVAVKSKSKEDLEKEIKDKIKGKLKKKSDIYYFKNLYIELTDLLIKAFKSYFIRCYDMFIGQKEKEESIKNLIISKIKNQFKELKSKIEEYNKNSLSKKKKKDEGNDFSQGAQNFLAGYLNENKNGK